MILLDPTSPDVSSFYYLLRLFRESFARRKKKNLEQLVTDETFFLRNQRALRYIYFKLISADLLRAVLNELPGRARLLTSHGVCVARSGGAGGARVEAVVVFSHLKLMTGL